MQKIIPFLLLILLTGCATQPASPYVPPDVGGQAALDAQATLAVWSALQTSTADALAGQAVATREAIDATSTMQAAAANATATRMAEAGATSTAVVFEATMGAVYLQQTREADAIVEARRRAEIDEEMDRVAIAAAATSSAQQHWAHDLNLERRATVNRLLPWAAGIVGLVVVTIIGAAMFFIWQRLRPVVVVAPHRHGAMILARRDFAALPSGHHEPAPNPSSPPLLTDGVAGDVKAPRWEAFAAWDDPWRVPIGVDASGAPIFLNRQREPHVAILGASGSGKTQSGLWPITSAYLALGMNVVVANGRGADFNAFRRHPNAHVLPAVDYEAGPDQLAELLAAIMQEVARRDQVLADTNTLHWADLGRGEELAIVIDEFTSLAARANADAAGEMWHALQRLTHEARKYGIYAVFTMTDQTQRAIGGAGATVVNQCARIAFGVRSAAMARAFIENDDAVGLAPGQFIASVGRGRPVRGSAFHPSPDDVAAFLESRPVQAQPLPALVSRAAGHVPTASNGEGDLQAAVDAADLRYADRGRLTSLNKVAQFLAGKEGNANADEYRRAARALMLLVDDDADEWARQLLEGSSSDVVREEIQRAHLIG